jgi:hypothetical protein
MSFVSALLNIISTLISILLESLFLLIKPYFLPQNSAECMMSSSAHQNPSPGQDENEGSRNSNNFSHDPSSNLVGHHTDLQQAVLLENIVVGAMIGATATKSFTPTPIQKQVVCGAISGALTGYQATGKVDEEEAKIYNNVD